jgi:hypothetical protein
VWWECAVLALRMACMGCACTWDLNRLPLVCLHGVVELAQGQSSQGGSLLSGSRCVCGHEGWGFPFEGQQVCLWS